jgi:hypothetical protein
MNCDKKKTLFSVMSTFVFYALAGLPVLAQVPTNEMTRDDKTKAEILEDEETQKCLEHEISIGIKSNDFSMHGFFVDLANGAAFYCSKLGFLHNDELIIQARKMIITKCLDYEIAAGMAQPNFGSMGSIGGLTYRAAYRCSQHGTFYSQELTDQASQMIHARLTPSQKAFVDKMRERMLGTKENKDNDQLLDLANPGADK